MARIRSDLVGVVIIHDANHQSVILSAGDEVPDGITVGDHVLEPEAKASPRPRTTK